MVTFEIFLNCILLDGVSIENIYKHNIAIVPAVRSHPTEKFSVLQQEQNILSQLA